MKAEYKRDLKNNYLVIEADSEKSMEEYMIHMTEQNVIPGLLPMQVRKMDGSCYLYYEITSRQSMEDVYEKKVLTFQDILYILSEIQETLEAVRRYLLNPHQILFDPQYMYVDPESLRISFCYYPSSCSEVSVSVLAEYILKKLDHQDSKAVSLGYLFYQRSSGENFSLSETLHEILEKDWKEHKKKEVKPEYGSSDTGSEVFRYDENAKQEELREEYELFHKGKKAAEEEYKKKNGIRLFQIIHPAVLIGCLLAIAGTEILLYFGWIDLTEAGGVLFLSLAIAVWGNRFWIKQKEKKNVDQYSFKDEEERETLREDMENLRMELYHSESQDLPYEDKTQLLSDMEIGKSGLWLSSDHPERYPSIHLQEKILIVGKTKGQADILLQEAAVSRIHARLETRQGYAYIRDMNSKNGTYVNGVRLSPQKEMELREGDIVMFANIRYYVTRCGEDSDMTQLLH